MNKTFDTSALLHKVISQNFKNNSSFILVLTKSHQKIVAGLTAS